MRTKTLHSEKHQVACRRFCGEKPFRILLAILVLSHLLSVPIFTSKLAVAAPVAAPADASDAPAADASADAPAADAPAEAAVPDAPDVPAEVAEIGIEVAEGQLAAASSQEFTTIGVPTITSDDPAGLPVIGVALHANPGIWAPVPESFSYQWYSFQNPIDGATAASYVPTYDDYCNEISVKVTAYRQGYQSATAQSAFVQPEPAGGDDGGGEDGEDDEPDEEDSNGFRADSFPWAAGVTTGNYIKDSYSAITTNHVFESVTQERLLDILSSAGNYYLVFAGPSRETSQKILGLINEQAQSAGITKIYHFDPLIDGYQVDITKAGSPYKTTESVHALWTRITDLLPTGEPIASYDLLDTLLFRYSASSAALGTRGTIAASYSLTPARAGSFTATAEKAQIASVFKNGNATVASSVRTSLQFFNRVYNASASLVNSRLPSAEYKVDASAVTLFDGLTEANFKLRQINFAELQNLYKSPSEHIILYGASWCHNTQAIIGAIAAQAAANSDVGTVYVYDTTLGNQIRFGTGSNVNTASAYSSTFNSRNNSVAGPAGNNNVSYIYGEAVRPLGTFLSENNTNRTNSVQFYPNGDLSGATLATSVAPWNATSSTAASTINAIRLQLPFLVAYNKDANSSNKAVRQWLHKQTSPANEGKYLEYMLELAWVRAGQATSAADAAAKGVVAAYQSTIIFKNSGISNDRGLTVAQAGAEAIAQVEHVVGEGDNTTDVQPPDETPETDEPQKGTLIPAAATATPAAAPAAKAPVTPYYLAPGSGAGTAASRPSAAGRATPLELLGGAKAATAEFLPALSVIPEAATPLGDSTDVPATKDEDAGVPLAAAAVLAALAVFAVIGVSTGFIPVPKSPVSPQ
ncbi:MAG: hypothetical protein LBP28_08660 [Coriobacteriales bacterium]|jgi:hypothetical protein|nr:hypothetical protein [Coriobacteriales bacterium]